MWCNLTYFAQERVLYISFYIIPYNGQPACFPVLRTIFNPHLQNLKLISWVQKCNLCCIPHWKAFQCAALQTGSKAWGYGCSEVTCNTMQRHCKCERIHLNRFIGTPFMCEYTFIRVSESLFNNETYKSVLTWKVSLWSNLNHFSQCLQSLCQRSVDIYSPCAKPEANLLSPDKIRVQPGVRLWILESEHRCAWSRNTTRSL